MRRYAGAPGQSRVSRNSRSQASVRGAERDYVRPLSDQEGELLARPNTAEDLDRTDASSVEVLEVGLGGGVDALRRELSRRCVPADPVGVYSFAPVAAELERVPAARGVGVEEVRVADVGEPVSLVFAHAAASGRMPPSRSLTRTPPAR